tara:strand:- start:153 stop:1814 length:1662 start_codon:yes stop_codon:yes gene_type:complete
VKHTFSRLARGVKLQTGHIYTAVTRALANLTSDAGTTVGVEVDQMAQPSGPFTLHLSVPTFDGGQKAFSIPFTLPAYQSDTIWATGYQDVETPTFRVESVGFSFDNGDELAAVGGYARVDNNKLDFGGLSNCKLEVSLLETLQSGRGAIASTSDQSRYATVWSSTIPATAWEAGLNPVTFSEISANLSPLKTYILKVVAPDLDGTPECRFPNLNIWLNMSTPLVRRDRHVPASGEYVQNLPSVHNGTTQVTAITTTEPAAGSKITAETATPTDAYDGVQTALGKVDKLFRDKLRGNYNIHSELPADENLTDNAAYKIIAVPMWGNLRFDITPSLVEANMPYAGAFPCTAMMTDRRIIPISNNFTVHHVVACANYGKDDRYPTAPTFSHNVGVGIGSGLRSDLHTYQEVAYKSWQPYAPHGAGILLYGIDRLGVILDDTLQDNWEMVGIPLVEITGQSSTNYGQQGKPFFIGQSRYNSAGPSGTNVRTNVGKQPVDAGGTPNTAGQESFIEVRWGIQDTNGAASLTPSDTVIAPRYGNWVYIIGKTTTVTSNQE